MSSNWKTKRGGILKKLINIFLCVLFIAGCGVSSLKYGEDITENNVIAIDSIMKSPEKYADKTVKIKGKIIRECPTGCWFDLRDDTGIIYVDLSPSNFAIPQKVNSKAVVQGKIKVINKKPIIVGNGVEI